MHREQKNLCEENGTSSAIQYSPPPRGPGTKQDRSQEFGGSQEPKTSNRRMANEFTLGGKIAPGYYYRQAKTRKMSHVSNMTHLTLVLGVKL